MRRLHFSLPFLLVAAVMVFLGSAALQAQTKTATPEAAQASPAPSGPAVTSLREVKKLYVEAMPNELDKYIRAEIVAKMPNRLVIVTHKEDADAIMTGTSGTKAATVNKNLSTATVTITDNRGSVVLWTAEESERAMPGWSKMAGGQKRIAEKLVDKLKDSTK